MELDIKDIPGNMALMHEDGNTYDNYGRFLCKTHPSQIRSKEMKFLWTLERAAAERQAESEKRRATREA